MKSSTTSYETFAKSLYDSGIITDPWLDGAPRFAAEPMVISLERARELARVGELSGELFHEAVELVADDLALLDDFFGLTPVQKAMFEAQKPLWHGIARADVFFTKEGPTIAELNCDTPTGEAEAWVLGRIAREKRPKLIDPNADLEPAFIRMVERMCEALVTGDARRSVGLVYPTEFTEDLSLVRLYKRWLEAAGFDVALGSPYNLSALEDDATVRVFDEPVSLLVRHYKTDWWSERASAWTDEELLDPAPLTGPLYTALRAQAEGKTAIVNPFGAVVPQNKRTMAFMWEHIHRFSLRGQDLIRELIPITSRLESLHPELLRAQREQWVLKSDYGAEGEEVVIGKLCSADEWAACLDLARKGRWVAQRYFEAELDAEGRHTNFGVFLIAGQAAGLYVRRQSGATDASAESVPVLIDPG